MNGHRLLLAAALVAVTATAGLPAVQAADLDAGVTLRVAPEGFVVPSLHWSTNAVADTTTEAVWIHDPAQDDTLNDQDGVAGCEPTVPDTNGNSRIDGVDVLDHATDTGCISGWDGYIHDKYGWYVESVDGLEEQGWPVSWWQIQVDGHVADVGISNMDLQDGQDLSFVYYAGP